MAKRISIINFKGGVGKTTLAFHLGIGLASFHDARVLLIDMDHQSSLSIVCLGADRWQVANDEGETVDEIFRTFVNPSTPPSDEIIIKAPVHSRNWNPHTRSVSFSDGMDVVPASLHLDDTEIELTASHQGNAIHSEWNKRTLMCRWIEETGIDDEYDYIIFDCPPATKIVSQNAIAASHGYIIPVVPEAVMERGAPHLRDMMTSGIDTQLKALASMGEPRTIHVPDTELVGLVITRIQTSGNAYSGYTDDHTQHLRSLESRWSNLLIEPYIGHGAGITEALSAGIPIYDRSVPKWGQNIRKRRLHTQYIDLIDEIKRRVDAL